MAAWGHCLSAGAAAGAWGSAGARAAGAADGAAPADGAVPAPGPCAAAAVRPDGLAGLAAASEGTRCCTSSWVGSWASRTCNSCEQRNAIRFGATSQICTGDFLSLGLC